MKHGSHIMLQRLVRSIVSTAPRPYLIDEVPWLCSVSVTAGKSRPGNSDSSRRRNGGLTASVSTKLPWIGQLFSMTTLPSRSRMCALISPVCSLTSDSTVRRPDRIASRVSRTHVGHKESVVRGQPNCGDVRSWLLSSGASAHFGWNALAATRRLTNWSTGHSALAPTVSPISSGFHARAGNGHPIAALYAELRAHNPRQRRAIHLAARRRRDGVEEDNRP